MAENTVGLKKLSGNKTVVVPTLTIGGEFDSTDKVCEVILSNTTEVAKGYTVTLEGKILAYLTDKSAVENAINARLSAYNVEGANCESYFAQNLQVTNAFFCANKETTATNAIKTINTLDVVTVATTTKIVTVSYDTETRKDASKDAGVLEVITQGVDGEAQRVEKVVLLNGEISADPEVSETVLVYPITEVIVIGTKNVYITSTPSNASASGFKWPLAIRGTITSYWGDGRGHKGVDIGVPVGTQIVAVKSGTVVEAKYTSDYGYYVTIDHGNGVQTRYAHNSQNVVEVGQVVSAGQVIALSGNTGRSTGPHLHFEVIINGNRVNPGYYINL